MTDFYLVSTFCRIFYAFFVHFAQCRRGAAPAASHLTAVRAASLDKGVTLGTFRHCRICLVCADLDAVKAAVVLGLHVELALGNGAVDVGILLHLVHHHESFFL